MKNKLYKINKNDNVAVALEPLKAGYYENGVVLTESVPFGHKALLADLKAGEKVIKYGYPIGSVTVDVKKGSHIHTHNLKSDLSETGDYRRSGDYLPYKYSPKGISFSGYKRENGEIGIRNDIWIIPTVGCVNKTAERLCEIARGMIGENCTGVKALTHPYGCSQMGGDQNKTQKILASLVNHPNAAGVLVVSLGCENNNLNVFKPFLGNINEKRVKFLVAQSETDEIETGVTLLKELLNYADEFKREPIPAEKLKIGLKCGGSDAFSGITANALCGRFTDLFTEKGGSAVLTEVPEMFGAEQILMSRAENENVFNDMVNLIRDFKDFFSSRGLVVYENPSPGNRAGGITTLEEKSLGCVQKGGRAVVTDIIRYGNQCRKKGLSLLEAPGNDIVSATALTAAGAHMILFTTGRGTPLGAPIPTIKISSNSLLYTNKPNWIDFNAGDLLYGALIDDKAEELFNLVIDVACGKKTKNEINGYSEIAIFKDGVTL